MSCLKIEAFDTFHMLVVGRAVASLTGLIVIPRRIEATERTSAARLPASRAFDGLGGGCRQRHEGEGDVSSVKGDPGEGMPWPGNS